MKHFTMPVVDLTPRQDSVRSGIVAAEPAQLWASCALTTGWRSRLITCLLPVALIMMLVTQFTSQPCRAEPQTDTDRERLILVVGAGGTAEYEVEFASWAAAWQSLARHRNWRQTLIGGEPEQGREAESTQIACRDRLHTAIQEQVDSNSRLWIVMLGHGTAVGENAKFNLPGPDVSARELSAWLDPLSCPVIVINCSAASGPFLPMLSAPGRIVVTATRSGTELNYSRFGEYLASALQDKSADLDHDLEVSLLEAFLTAVARTEQFYHSESRLASEHALLDDNGDARGTGGEFFRGLRPIQTAEMGAPLDGQRAARVILYSSPEALQLTQAQLDQREGVEKRIDALRTRKEVLEQASYYQQLEALLLELSAIYEAAEM